MPQIKDQYHDPAYATLYHLLQENPQAADFVKTSSLDEESINMLPASAFAWPEQRLFPIDTPENTVISQLYREKHASVPVDVDSNLRKAIEIYGVENILAHKKEAAASPPIDESKWLLPQHKRLHVKTAEDVKTAEQLLLEQYCRLSTRDRAEGFTNLVKQARDLGVQLTPVSYRMAGMTACDPKIAHDFIEARRCATDVPFLQQAYTKLAALFAGSGQTLQDRDDLLAVTDTLAELDKCARLEHLYDKKLPDPIRTVFNTEKLAEETLDIAGRPISLSKLAALPSTFWSDVVGPEMVKEITDSAGAVDSTKLAQVVPTLPLDLKIILKNQVP